MAHPAALGYLLLVAREFHPMKASCFVMNLATCDSWNFSKGKAVALGEESS